MGCVDFMRPRRRYGTGLVEKEKVAVVPISGALFAEIVSWRFCKARFQTGGVKSDWDFGI